MIKNCTIILFALVGLLGCRERLDQEYRFFGRHDLNTGEYKLLALGGIAELIEDYDQFYIEDPEILSKMQDQWVFKHKGDLYKCGYSYRLKLVNQDTVLNSMGVNIDCGYTSNGLYFPKHFLTDYKSSFLRMTEEEAQYFGKKFGTER